MSAWCAPRTRSLLGGHGVKRADEIGIEGRAEADGLGKAGGADGGVAVEAFLVKKDGDAETRVLDEKFLDGVGEDGGLAGFFADASVSAGFAAGVAGAGRSGRIPWPWAKCLRAFLKSKLPLACPGA